MTEKMQPPPDYPSAPPGYPQQPPPPAGYAQQPPPAGYAAPPAGYAQQPPPPPGYQQPMGYPQGQPGQTVIVNQPIVSQSYGSNPATITCPYCQATCTTSTNSSCGSMVWIVAGVICLIGLFIPFLWLGCCLIPFCIPSLYDVEHSCANCQRQVGVFHAGGM